MKSEKQIDMSPLDKLPKDVIEKILYKVTSKDFVNFCESYIRGCQKEEIWRRRFDRDFGKYKKYLSSPKNYKDMYLDFYTLAKKAADKLVEVILATYGNVKNYLKDEYGQDLWYKFYNTFWELLDDTLDRLEKSLTEISPDNPKMSGEPLIFAPNHYIYLLERKFFLPERLEHSEWNNLLSVDNKYDIYYENLFTLISPHEKWDGEKTIYVKYISELLTKYFSNYFYKKGMISEEDYDEYLGYVSDNSDNNDENDIYE